MNRLGIRGAAREFGVGRRVVLAVANGGTVMPGTLALLERSAGTVGTSGTEPKGAA